LIRRELTNAQWRRIEPLIPGKEGDKGRHGEDNRLFVDAVLWLVRAGAPWRDLPEEFGKWNSVFRRFRRWARKGVWKRLFTELGEDPDLEYRDSVEPLSLASHSVRQAPLRGAQFGRAVHQQDQALSSHRHTLRENRTVVRVYAIPGRRHDMARASAK
jgi:transposase